MAGSSGFVLVATVGRYAIAAMMAVALLAVACALETAVPVTFGHHLWTYMAGWEGGIFMAWFTRRRPS